MAPGSKVPSERDEYPPQADLRRDVYQPLPVIPSTAVCEKGIAPGEAANHARAVLESMNDALESADAGGGGALTKLFFRDQSYWRDILALTYHIRTIRDAGPIVSTFSETRRQRGASRLVFVEDSAVFAPVTPSLVCLVRPLIWITTSNSMLYVSCGLCSNGSVLLSNSRQRRRVLRAVDESRCSPKRGKGMTAAHSNGRSGFSRPGWTSSRASPLIPGV